MEGELFNMIQKHEGETQNPAPEFSKQFPEISFLPKEETTTLVARLPFGGGASDRCAFAGLTCGAIAVLSWIVIVIGGLVSLGGIIFSIFGLRSNHPRFARVGLGLSIVGLVLSIWYVFAAYSGRINYNYFTSEFWEATSGVEKGVK